MTVSLSFLRDSGSPANVKDYGALGNGIQIDGPYIKAALVAADNVFCPPGVYLFDTGQLLQLKGKRLFGVPGKTIFRHTSPTSDTTRNAFFYLGNMHPYWYDTRNATLEKFKRFAVTGAVAKGQRVFTLTAGAPTGGDATDLGAGKMVWLRHATEYTRTGWAQPDFAQLVRVESLSGATLTLERSANEPMSSALISPVGTDRQDLYLGGVLGTPCFAGICEDCVFEDLIFEGGAEAFSRTGAYRCTLRNIEHRGSLLGPLFNAFVECLIDNYRAEFSTWFCEVKQSCSDTEFRSLHGTYRPRPGITMPNGWTSDNNSGNVIYPMDIGERSNRLVFRDMSLKIGPEWTGVQRCIDIADAWNIVMDGNRVDISGGGAETVLGIRGNSDNAGNFPTKDITYSNGSYNVGIAKTRNASLQGTSAMPLTGIRYINNKWSGVTTLSSQHIAATGYCQDWLVQDDVRNAYYCIGERAASCLPPRRGGYAMRL